MLYLDPFVDCCRCFYRHVQSRYFYSLRCSISFGMNPHFHYYTTRFDGQFFSNLSMLKKSNFLRILVCQGRKVMTSQLQAFLLKTDVQNITGCMVPNWDKPTTQSSFPKWGDPQEQLHLRQFYPQVTSLFGHSAMRDNSALWPLCPKESHQQGWQNLHAALDLKCQNKPLLLYQAMS